MFNEGTCIIGVVLLLIMYRNTLYMYFNKINTYVEQVYLSLKYYNMLIQTIGGYRNIFSFVKEYIIFRIKLGIVKRLGIGYLRKINNTYELSYMHGCSTYKVLSRARSYDSLASKITTKSKCCYIVDDKGNNVTTLIKEYMGPNNDFHGIATTPGMMGYESLSFMGTTFEKNDIINV